MTTESPTKVDSPSDEKPTLSPADSRRLWADALRSGKYRQGQGALREKDPAGGADKFCCLGVACDVYRENGGALEEIIEGDFGTIVAYRDSGGHTNTGVLPKDVRDWLDITASGTLNHGGSLTQMNDNGYTFEQLATVIEEGNFEKPVPHTIWGHNC